MKGPGSGTLFVVATPIGNLEDITLRALRVLREVAVVAAEDTRRTGNLLRHYEIQTKLLSLHEHNEHARAVELLRRLAAGDSVALVTDAGTPGISDPGAGVVQAARQAGVRVEPVPGASAVTTALSGAGLAASRFVFAGYPPFRSNERKNWVELLQAVGSVPVVFFEAPHRLHRTLEYLVSVLGNRPIIVARELTKIHEEWLQGSAAELLKAAEAPRGEYVLVIAPRETEEPQREAPTDEQIAEMFGQITEFDRLARRDAIRQVATTFGISARSVYAALERAKNSG